jgi:HD-GYP domain-containing protein (c-di-GMP phosphodiesterase class II)
MWNKPGQAVPIDPSQVVVGLYLWLDVRWDEHPFLSNRLMVKTPKDVAVINSLDVTGRLYCYPDKSATTIPAFAPPAPAADAAAVAEATAAAEAAAAMAAELKQIETAKKEKRQKQKDAAARADRAWENAARNTKEALLTLNRSPKAAGELIAALSKETAASIANGQEILLHLLGDKKDQGPQFHALNVLTLSMLLGKKMGLTERELADLAMGALAHDAGKVQVPPQILKNPNRKKHEEDFFRQHVMFSVQLASTSGAFTREALGIIADHHEAANGTGWPRGRRDSTRGARILAVVNRYDNLCTPEAIGVEPLMPAEALARMFRIEGAQHDPALLGALIKLLGVYPPGTVVQLNDTSLALVVAPGPESLRPQVLVYTPEIPKDEAPTIELHTEPDLKIIEAIKPATLPPDVLAWLNPQQRLSYFFSVENAKA